MRYSFDFYSTKNTINGNRRTDVEVYDSEHKEILTASIMQYFRDTDNKILGQKLVIKKIVKKYNLSMLDKKTLWLEFFTSTPRRLKYFNPRNF